MAEQQSIEASYQENYHRLNMLYIMLLSRRYNSRLRFVLNKETNECHLNNCSLSQAKHALQPLCHCHFTRNPKDIFEMRAFEFLSYPNWSQEAVNDPVPQTTDEGFDIFFRRLCDKENISKWYDSYYRKTKALAFQKFVRELNMHQEIDACYHKLYDEWHLTDCKRWLLNKEEWPDTCHCSRAMENPEQYLRKSYNILDKVLMEKMKKRISPMDYSRRKKY